MAYSLLLQLANFVPITNSIKIDSKEDDVIGPQSDMFKCNRDTLCHDDDNESCVLGLMMMMDSGQFQPRRPLQFQLSFECMWLTL